MKKNLVTFFLFVIALSSFSFTQAQTTTATVNDNCGIGVVDCPKVYGGSELINAAPAPIAQPIQNPAPTPVATTPTVETKPLIQTGQSGDLFSKFNTQKLKIDLHGIGKNCLAGQTQAIPWSLVNNGQDIDTKEELLVVLDSALKSDYRIRRITINDNILTIHYLQPAKLFGFIPVNYLFTIITDVNTQSIRVKDTRWSSFASMYHDEVGQTLAVGLSPILTQQNIALVAQQNQFYRHSFSTAVITSVMTPVNIYPYSNTFWICVIVPFFILFLILFGVIFGLIMYYLAKRKREKYIHHFKYGHQDKPHDKDYSESVRVRRVEEANDIDDDEETLDQYLESKRFKDKS